MLNTAMMAGGSFSSPAITNKVIKNSGTGQIFTDAVGEIWNAINGTKQKQQIQREENDLARQWQEYSTKNQYLWNKEGMEKAGLNPYLMYGNLGGTENGPTVHSAGSTGNGNLFTASAGVINGILNGIGNVIHSTGTMTASMNSKNELKAKGEAYDYANRLLNTAVHLFEK